MAVVHSLCMQSSATRLTAFALPCLALAIIGAVTVTAYAVHVSATEDATRYAEYRNDRWGFSLAVPANMTVGEYEREGDGQSIQFTDPTGEKLFTISAWPYTQLDLTLGREGTPSGTWDQPDHLEIADMVRDDVFTVLFQKNGVRYVVVTMPKHEAWLIEILKTWQFVE